MTAKKANTKTEAPEPPVAETDATDQMGQIELPPSLRIAPGQVGHLPHVIAKAIIAIQNELKPLVKTAENTEYNSSFVPLSVVFPRAQELLQKHSLGVTQWPVSADDKAYLVTVLFHESGVSISGELELLLSKRDLQGLGSAITYARRYGLMSILGMVAEDDDDGNKAAGRQAKPTLEQIAEIKQLCIDLRYPLDQVEKRIATLRTEDHATIAINNLRDQISQRARVLNGEKAESIPVFTGSRDEVSQSEGTKEETRVENLQRRLIALKLPDQIRRTFVVKLTGKPFMDKCTPEELNQLEDQIKELEARKADGIEPPEPTA